MKQMKYFLLFTFLLLAGVTHAQKIKVKKGDFKFLKGQKDVNVIFVYDNMKLFKDNLSEEEYVASRTKDLNEKSKGKGDNWAKKWEASKDFIWEAKLLEVMNKSAKKSGIFFTEDAEDTKYTLIVETTWMYPGWNVGIMRQGAKVTTTHTFVETDNHKKVKLKINSENAPGDSFGGTYSNEDRIGEGYAKTGKSLGKLISKKAK